MKEIRIKDKANIGYGNYEYRKCFAYKLEGRSHCTALRMAYCEKSNNECHFFKTRGENVSLTTKRKNENKAIAKEIREQKRKEKVRKHRIAKRTCPSGVVFDKRTKGIDDNDWWE